MNELETLKKALEWYMGMYGCSPEKSVYGKKVEYSCNGYVVDKEEAEAIAEAKDLVGWWD